MKLKLFIPAAVVIVGLLVTVWMVGSSLTKPVPKVIGAPPQDLQGSSVEFPSLSGANVKGWFVPGQPARGAILLLHGVRANRLSMVERARFLSRAGYSVLLIDQQAHGESSGKQITFGYLESRDARAAVEFLRQNAAREKIGVIGVSMGGAATILAEPKLNVDAVMLEMVYPTVEEAVANRLAMRLGSWSQPLTPLLTLQLKLRLGIDPRELRPIDKVSEITAPKLFIAASEDRHTTVQESQRLFDVARAPKEIWIVSGAKHEDLHRYAPTEYEQRVLRFFANTLATVNEAQTTRSGETVPN